MSIGEHSRGEPQTRDTFRGIVCRFWLYFALALTGFGGNAQDQTLEATDDDGRNADAGYRYLLMEASTSVPNKGLTTRRIHHRIEIQKQHAVDVIGNVSIPYNAFRSEARVVKAFTLTAEGRTVNLKKGAVHDLTPDEVSSCQMYTDVHQLTFSMPALGKGAIMDYEVEIEEKRPVMAGEFWISEFLDAGVQVCTSRVTVTFPAKREVRLVATNLSAQAAVADKTSGNVRRLSWEMSNVPALEYEPGMPPYSCVRPQVHLTSVKSWEQVAQWYAGLAKNQLQADAEIQKQARMLVNGLTNQQDQIQALYSYASRDVRYVGVELGRSSYEPHSPRQTMQNKYGDCKDKAALLVSLLNGIGIQSHIALVRPNDEGPVDQSLPGPAQFNHAIVYVPREAGDLWIDATEPFGEVTEHGYHLDDTAALVINLRGKTFVHIPTADEQHSVHRLIFDLDVHYGGLCNVREIQEFAGRAAVNERNRLSRLDAEKFRKQLAQNLSSGSSYGRLLNYTFSNPTNSCGLVRSVLDYESDTFLTGTKGGLSLRLDGGQLRGWLEIPQPTPASAQKHKRVHPWVTRVAHTEEIICRLHLGQGYVVAHPPAQTQRELPHGKAEVLFSQSDDTPCLTLRVTCRPTLLKPELLPDVAQQVNNAIARISASLDLEDKAADLLKQNRYAKAEASIVGAARCATNSADALLRLGSYYRVVGRVYPARVAFENAIALAPKNPHAYALLAATYSGWCGMPGEGFDRKSIMAVYDRALTNVPVRAWALNRKGDAWLIDDQGQADSTNHLEEAEQCFRELLKEDDQSYNGLLGLGEVNRLRRHFEKAEDYYGKAARLQPGEAAPRAGIWLCMALAGRDDQAWNAMSEYYGPGQQFNTEVIRVASLLARSRQYETAARLYERLSASFPQPEAIQKFARLMQKADKLKGLNYTQFYDDSSPEGVAQTLLISMLMGDTGKAFRCLSPAVNRDAVKRGMQEQARLINRATSQLGTNCLADLMLSSFEFSQRTLDNGDVEMKLDGSKSGLAGAKISTFQVQKAKNRWRSVSVDEPELDCATFGLLALDALERGELRPAMFWQSRIAELERRPREAANDAARAMALHLQEIPFTNDILRAKAWASLALLGSQDRASIVRATACLESVTAAHPNDAELQILLAFAQSRLANTRRAAAILDTINISKLASPEQLGRLGWTLLDIDKLDIVDKVVTRLREVAPDSETLQTLQAAALDYRGKHTEAATTWAKLRESSKVNPGLYISGEAMSISLNGNQTALRDFLDRWREQDKSLLPHRLGMAQACLALGLHDEASEQIALMLAQGELTAEALVGYAEVALARRNTAEARHLVDVADHLANRSPEQRLTSLGLAHLALGDYDEAARIFRNYGIHLTSRHSGYSLCMSALASQLAGDSTTASETLKVAASMQGDSDWPRLAIGYIGGDISESEFRRAPERTADTPLTRASRECEVNCIIALLKESKHDLAGALPAYEACLGTQAVSDQEYIIAKLALQRLRQTPQAQTTSN